MKRTLSTQRAGKSRHNGEIGNEHGYGVLNTEFAKERKGSEGCFVILTSEFYSEGFALNGSGWGDRVFGVCFGCNFWR